MLGWDLPTSLEVDGIDYKIDSNFKTALLIMRMYNNGAVSPMSKNQLMLEMLFTTYDEEKGELVTNIPENANKAAEKAVWFLNCGRNEDKNHVKYRPKTIDYEEDGNVLFAAVNDAAGFEVRSVDYMHWFTFCAHCSNIKDGTYMSTVVTIRYKLANNIKLTKEEKDVYEADQDFIDISNGDYNQQKIDLEMMLSQYE